MELNTQLTGSVTRRMDEYMYGTSGLSSPSQLVSFAASFTVNLDQTASGTQLVVFGSQHATHATKMVNIRKGSFERLGDAWRALADQ